MNILVLTSSMIDSHFSSYQEKAKIKPNPSNQCFYSKLIKALSIDNNVHAVTLRPFVKGMFKEKSLQPERFESGKTTYYYTYGNTSSLYKTFFEENEIIKTAKQAIEDFHSNDFVIITTTLRYHLLKAAIKLGKIYNVKVVGMLTDNPLNLSNVSSSYTTALENYALQCDAYLSLTRKLVDNLDDLTPSYVFDGLVQNESGSKKDPISGYFFFAGSLYERYGVKKLVDAFHQSECKSKLVIAGSGPLSKYIDKVAQEDYRILFLSQISHEKVISYELNAIANINPRPLNNLLDSESVPSKLLEYLSTGVPTISTKFPRLYMIFKDDVTWFEDETTATIAYTLEEFEKSDINEAKKKALVAKNKAFEIFGLKTQAESITNFLKKL